MRAGQRHTASAWLVRVSSRNAVFVLVATTTTRALGGGGDEQQEGESDEERAHETA